MTLSIKQLAARGLQASAVLLALNELRGLVLAGPVIYVMYQAGGTLMAFWLGFCSFAGILLSITLPLLCARKLRARLAG
jgi:hypothetical protein